MCTGLTGNTFHPSNNTCLDSDGNSTGNATSKITCTGLTGNIFIHSVCDNDASNNADKDSCESGGGIFTPSVCEDENGNVLVSGRFTGLSANQTSCEGNATGNIFKAAHGNLCLDESGSVAGDSTSISTCEVLRLVERTHQARAILSVSRFQRRYKPMSLLKIEFLQL